MLLLIDAILVFFHCCLFNYNVNDTYRKDLTMTKKSLLIILISSIFTIILASALFYYLYSSAASNAAPPSSEGQHTSNNEPQASPSGQIENNNNHTDDQTKPDTEHDQAVTDETDTDFENSIMNQVKLLTIEEKIGQLIIAGIDGTTINNDTKLLLDQYKIGNFILFKRNLKSEKQIKQFTTELHQYRDSNMPLWISIDQEGGVVNRLPQAFPSAEELGKNNSIEGTKQIGTEMGAMLHELGFQMDFAPVLDINSNPDNPIIGSRAYGNSAEIVSKHSVAMMEALQSQGVIAVGKHFPGHGDTKEDSHLTLPAIDKTWDELMELELIPFVQAIEHHIDGIMVSHLLVPKVDPQYPASLSHEFVTNKLRKQLGFEGLIITDDLEMKGITNDYSVGEAAVLAIQAGADMVIIGHELKRQQDAFEQIKLAVSNGTIDIEEINERVYRILSYKLAIHAAP